MADLIFYTNPQSRGRIVRWMLEEIGQPYETEVVPYDQIKSAAYLAINPMGKVPAIKHDGRIVTECAAICAYLADIFPEAALAPRADEKADYYRWMFYAAGPIEAAVSNQAMGWVPTPERERMFGYGLSQCSRSCSQTANTSAATGSLPPMSTSARRSCFRCSSRCFRRSTAS